MKIAVIGSGVSGLVSAYLLSENHAVTVFEKDKRIGGHAHTIQLEESGEKIAVDNGFMVYNPDRYPYFVKLLEELKVKTTKTSMTFGVDIKDEIKYSGKIPRGLFADKNNVFSLRFYRFLLGIYRFRRLAKKHLKSTTKDDVSLGDFLIQNRINADVANWYLYPQLAAIWSIQKNKKIPDFPALSTFVFLNNHKLLDNVQPTWRTIVGGSIEYVNKIEQKVIKQGGIFLLNQNISSVSRVNNRVKIVSNSEEFTFDKVILATHADISSKLISDISKEEKSALSKFSYSSNETVLHKDHDLAPTEKEVLSAWNYISTKGSSEAIFTYCMNILQHIPKMFPVFVTLNPNKAIDDKKIYLRETYEHPEYNLDILEGQRLVESLQGNNNTYFAGAYLGYGFHEDGVESAVNVARLLGEDIRWEK